MKTAQEYIAEAKDNLNEKKTQYPKEISPKGMGANATSFWMDATRAGVDAVVKFVKENGTKAGSFFTTNEVCEKERQVLRNVVNQFSNRKEVTDAFHVDFLDDNECATLTLRVK